MNCTHEDLKYEATVPVRLGVLHDGSPTHVAYVTDADIESAEDALYYCQNCHQAFPTWKAARSHLNTAYKETP